MQNIWSPDTPFIKLFGISHWIYLVFVVLAFIWLYHSQDNIRSRPDFYRKRLVLIAILLELIGFVWYGLATAFDLSSALPLHLSRLTSLLLLLYLLTQYEPLLTLGFYNGLFAYGTFVLPRAIYPAYHVMGFRFAASHLLTIIIPYFAYFAKGWQPSKRGLHGAYCFFLVYLLFINWFNGVVDGNYFYMQERPLVVFNDWSLTTYTLFVAIFTYAVFWLGYYLVPYFFKCLDKQR